MGNDKEDSGFGFKDKQKALDTLKLLEEHDMNYRRLTVRGLLGRAKRVLSLTKAEEKIKNIKEAMEVFENWLAELDANKSKDSDKSKEKKGKKPEKKVEKMEEDSDGKSSDEPAEKTPTDTVPGLGFKDREAAVGTLKELEGRDPDYQKLAVKGLIGRAQRVLTATKDPTKVANIKEAVSVFDKFLDHFDSEHKSRQNNAYLSLGIVKTCLKYAEERKLDVGKQRSFIAAYTSVNGEYKKLRTVNAEGGKTWDIVRNTALKELKEKFANSKLFNDKDEPSNDHLQLLLWAYSPEPAKVKKVIPETKVDRDNRKRKSSAGNESPTKKKKDE